MSHTNKAVFLDRDGVINVAPRSGHYITSREDFELLPGAAEAISLLNQNGYLVVVVTNQRCIARGLVTAEAVSGIHEKMVKSVHDHGGRIDGIYICPHDVEDACLCRKPKPGMLLQAASEHSIDLASSWMVGDSQSDILAGRSAGCRTIQVNDYSDCSADFFVRSLTEAVERILTVA